jgi:carboxyl-terminal processing protease
MGVGVVVGSPAEKGGIQKGDLLRAVDDEPVGPGSQHVTPDEVAVLLRGDVDTEVTLTIAGRLRDHDLNLQRAPLSTQSVRSKLVKASGSTSEKGEQRTVGVIKVPSFSKNAAASVKGAAQGLIDQGAQALIIDLRGNVGGYFPAGVDLAKELLGADQSIVSVNDRNGAGTEYRTETLGAIPDVPLVLLVDRNTASAAEVFAAALQENGRAQIVGEQTYGKGLVQTIARLQDGSALVVTVATYKTPQGNDINKIGIEPDVVVKCAPTDDVKCVPLSFFGGKVFKDVDVEM